MAEKKATTAIGARETKRAETAGLVSRVMHIVGNVAEIAGGFLSIENPFIGGPLVLGGVALNKMADGGEDIKSSHEGKSHANDALIAMARGGSPALALHGVVPPASLSSRVMDKMNPGSKGSDARLEAGRQAAASEQKREATPLSSEAPAVTPNAAPAASGAPHTHHGWTDAARAASAQARGARWSGPG